MAVSMQNGNPKGAVRRRRRVARAALFISPLMGVALWLSAQHKPSWYRPLKLDSESLQRVRREAVAQADDFGDRLVLGRPFEVTLTQREVNEWLTALPQIWPEANVAWPPEIHEPYVKFSPGTICLAAHVDRSVGQAILNIDLVPELSPDGRSVRVAASALRLGSLPIPRVLLERIASWVTPREAPENDAHRVALAELFSGLTTANRFVWPNGERPFRIRSARIMNAELRLGIEPL
jgi:hypothetical protein